MRWTEINTLFLMLHFFKVTIPLLLIQAKLSMLSISSHVQLGVCDPHSLSVIELFPMRELLVFQDGNSTQSFSE